jgi:osmotically-inducible protein OsmY
MSIKHIGNLNDQDIEDGLNAFLLSAVPEDYAVAVEFASGAATLRGVVPSESAARAVADLVLAHDGVESVINLVVTAAIARSEESPQPA